MNPYILTVDASTLVENMRPMITRIVNECVADALNTSMDKVSNYIDEFVKSRDGQYLIEDAVNSQMEELVRDAVSSVNLRVEID